ncbi:MAG: tetratricopeptide repeat-containing sensor histidine kinase [Bacteroidales bacterium]
MRKTSLALGFLLVSIVARAQLSPEDSLKSLLPKLSGTDLAQTYVDLARVLLDHQKDSSLYFANRAELLLVKNDPDDLLPHLYLLKGDIYEERKSYDRSLVHFKKAYDSFLKEGDMLRVARSATSMGNIYYDLGDYGEAYTYYIESLSSYQQLNDEYGAASMENNLGLVSHEMDKLEEAEHHYRKALRYFREEKSIEDECMALNNIGLIFFDRGQYDSTLVYFNEAVGKLRSDTVLAETEKETLGGLYNNIALTFSLMDDSRTSLQYLLRSLKLAYDVSDDLAIGTAFCNLGAVYGELGRTDSALYYLHQGLKIGRESGYKDLVLETYNELSLLHARLGNWGNAYNWRLRYDTVYKSLFNSMQADQIAQLRARYEQEISEKEIEQLHSESQVQRLVNKVFAAVIVLVVALVIIITMNLRNKKISNRILEERNFQITEALQKISESEKELQILNDSKDKIFSVVAHDLRNPVAAVSGFSELLYDNFDEFGVDTQKEYLLQIHQATQRIQILLENLLVWARSQMKAVKFEPREISVDETVEESLKELKTNADSKKVIITNVVEPGCKVYADGPMVRTILRNLVMNAIKFSFPGGRIRVLAAPEGDMCLIKVEDAGIGIQPEIQEKLFKSQAMISTPGTTGESGSGLGLVICREFAEKNGGSIRVESEPGNGSIFFLTLPRMAPVS